MSVVVQGSFDQLNSRQVRFLQEAARLGQVWVGLWSDQLAENITGELPQFPIDERLYLLEALRYVQQVRVIDRRLEPAHVYEIFGARPAAWVGLRQDASNLERNLCQAARVDYHIIYNQALVGFPAEEIALSPVDSPQKKVIVTGCYDWLHSGHVRFFEEAAQYGDLYVVVGNDANVRFLKGEKHPLFPQAERRYMVQAVRFVKQALITSGWGWMDAAPEIELIKPDIYLVNEDGDRPEKRAFCLDHGLEYVVLKRNPRPGLPRRESTKLRGF